LLAVAGTIVRGIDVKFSFNYYGDAFWNPVGGVKQGQGYDGRFAAIMDADLDQLVGWAVLTSQNLPSGCSPICNASFIPAAMSPIRMFRAMSRRSRMPSCSACTRSRSFRI
jgi:hypothetical protein